MRQYTFEACISAMSKTALIQFSAQVKLKVFFLFFENVPLKAKGSFLNL